MWNAGTITTLTNSGKIAGGNGGASAGDGPPGGAGVMNAAGASIGWLNIALPQRSAAEWAEAAAAAMRAARAGRASRMPA